MPPPGASTATSGTRQDPAAGVRKGLRTVLLVLGLLIMGIGLPLALAPIFHIVGILLFVVGLVMVLRNSFTARRRFIRAQRRHPKFFYPIRRMIRRDNPEVIPVLWHVLLRGERLITPRKLRYMRRLRRWLMRSRSGPATAA